ncbi:uncharacterized protein LOC114538085 [Dendronephthya gigantea]|uniref:uncharacterized protein LOC114538085 n=1 Tax=Dendronephthya gigantea TaxID=151771 RepID=UPI00106BC251|nr:uncharacterized protein LOC114538085 [Dendronephthya gigantea]
MASRFDAQSKGWRTYSKPIGSLKSYGPKFGRYGEQVKTLTEDDECIYYPTVYGEGDKLKIVSNPGYGAYGKSEYKTKDAQFKATKFDAYDPTDDGIYEVLSGKVAQPTSAQQCRSQFGNRNNHHTAAVPRSVLRALNNDFAHNTARDVLTFEPTGCRFPSPDLASNNNDLKKAKIVGHHDFVSPQSEHSLNAKEDSEELLDYCTCMCIVKGTFYHFTKDSDSEGHLADQPCSCAGPLSQCLPRWGCLGVFALIFPCLWCYLPLKGCKKLTELSDCSDTKPLEKKPIK